MKNEWDGVWVSPTQSRLIFEEFPQTLEEFAELFQKAEEALVEVRRTAKDGIDLETFYIQEDISGHEDGSVGVCAYICWDLSPEEIDVEKKRLWLLGKERRDKKDLAEFLRLKKKFETNDKELL